MVVLIRDEERARLNVGWHIVRGSEPEVERMLWGVAESFGEKQYVFLIERNGREQVFRDYEKGVVFATEREAWQQLAKEMEEGIAADKEELIRLGRSITEQNRELDRFRRIHGLYGDVP